MNRKSIVTGLLSLILLSILLATSCSAPSHATAPVDDWSMFQHDAAHTGYSDNSLPTSLVSLWNTSEPFVISNVAVARNYVYFVSSDKIHALNASSGQLVWSSPSSSSDTDIRDECPTVVDGYVYTKYCAYNASTGQLMLNYTSNGSYGSPTVADGILLINTNFGNSFGSDGLIAFNAKTGVKIWDFNEGRNIEGGNGHLPGFKNNPPAIANGAVYFPCASGIYAFNVQTGTQIWRVPINGFAGYTTVADGNVYCALREHGYYGSGVFYCFDASTGHSKWTCQTVAYQPSVSKGIVYVGSNALNASTGKTIWNNTLLTGSQAIAGDTVYSVSIRRTSDGGEYYSACEIHALNAVTGDEEWNYTLPDLKNPLNEVTRFPAIANGTLYISQSFGEFDASGVFSLGGAQPSSDSEPSTEILGIGLSIVAIVVAIVVFAIVIKYQKRVRAKLQRSLPQ